METDPRPSIFRHTPVKNLVDAGLIAFARLFVQERNQHEQATPGMLSTVILSKELSALQAALTDLLDKGFGDDTFIRLALREIGAQDRDTKSDDPDGSQACPICSRLDCGCEVDTE